MSFQLTLIDLYIFQFDFTQPPTTILRTRGHRFSITSAVASDSGKFLFTSGKEGSIIKWDLTSGKKLNTIYKVKPADLDSTKRNKGKGKAREEVKGHTDEVLALALSSDGKYLASAGRDRRLTVWDVEKDAWIKGFSPGGMGHKDVISVRTSLYHLCSVLDNHAHVSLGSCFPGWYPHTIHRVARQNTETIRSIPLRSRLRRDTFWTPRSRSFVSCAPWRHMCQCWRSRQDGAILEDWRRESARVSRWR